MSKTLWDLFGPDSPNPAKPKRGEAFTFYEVVTKNEYALGVKRFKTYDEAIDYALEVSELGADTVVTEYRAKALIVSED